MNAPAFVDLSKLHPNHKLRRTPLAEIGAELRNNAALCEVWVKAELHRDVARKTYNELPLSWQRYADWRVPAPNK